MRAAVRRARPTAVRDRGPPAVPMIGRPGHGRFRSPGRDRPLPHPSPAEARRAMSARRRYRSGRKGMSRFLACAAKAAAIVAVAAHAARHAIAHPRQGRDGRLRIARRPSGAFRPVRPRALPARLAVRVRPRPSRNGFGPRPSTSASDICVASRSNSVVEDSTRSTSRSQMLVRVDAETQRDADRVLVTDLPSPVQRLLGCRASLIREAEMPQVPGFVIQWPPSAGRDRSAARDRDARPDRRSQAPARRVRATDSYCAS